ncbi:MAG: STAS/SEC14 domain-containing protein [Gammaproteobacteria bacterium]
MINAQLLRDEGILVVSPAEKLETTDFERLRLLTDPYIEKHGDLNGLLIDAEAFYGWEDFSSMLSHIRFVRNYHKKIKRVAAVTDNDFLAILPKVADHFVAAEVRHYDYRDRDQALNWLRSGSGSEQ